MANDANTNDGGQPPPGARRLLALSAAVILICVANPSLSSKGIGFLVFVSLQHEEAIALAVLAALAHAHWAYRIESPAKLVAYRRLAEDWSSNRYTPKWDSHSVTWRPTVRSRASIGESERFDTLESGAPAMTTRDNHAFPRELEWKDLADNPVRLGLSIVAEWVSKYTPPEYANPSSIASAVVARFVQALFDFTDDSYAMRHALSELDHMETGGWKLVSIRFVDPPLGDLYPRLFRNLRVESDFARIEDIEARVALRSADGTLTRIHVYLDGGVHYPDWLRKQVAKATAVYSRHDPETFRAVLPATAALVAWAAVVVDVGVWVYAHSALGLIPERGSLAFAFYSFFV